MGKKKNKNKIKKYEETEELNDIEKMVDTEGTEKLNNFSLSIAEQKIKDNQDDIIITNFSIAAYGKELFKDTDLSIIKNNKYALIGPNGQGKSTLLMYLVHKKLPIPKNMDIFIVEQEIENSDKNVLQIILESNQYLIKLKKKQDTLNNLNRDLTEDEIRLYNNISQELSNFNFETFEPKAKKILNGLGFDPDMQQKSSKEFSGGWRMRISIAKALFMEPEILLLDEPTNHLDLNTVMWLQNYLISWKKTLVIVSHNQDFINEICSDIIHIRNKKIEQYKGNYYNFTKMLDQKKEVELKEWDKYQKRLKELKKNNSNKKSEEIAMKNDKKKNKKKLNDDESSSDKMIYEKINKPKDYIVKFSFENPPEIGYPLIDINNIQFSYNNTHNLFENLSIGIGPKDRICIVGPNGVGKSTLLKLMMGDLQPNTGDITINRKLRIGKYSQHFIDDIPNNLTPVSFLQTIDTNLNIQEARRCLGRYGLESHAHLIENKNLSGGQKARVQFAMINILKPHAIFLDEPTNHLDIESINALIDAINNYNGTIVIISHDSKLIEETECQLYICNNKSCNKFNGNLDTYRDLIINSIDSNEIISENNIDKSVSILDLL